VIPAHNEAPFISKVVAGAKRFVDEVIVVDDGSVDETASEAEKSGAQVLRHEMRMGKWAALRTGFSKALEMGADIIITMDGDGQHSPDDIPKFLEHLENGADVVVGYRKVRKGMPLIRKISNMITTFMANTFFSLQVSDSQCGFRAYREVLEKLLFTASGFEGEIETLVVAKRMGLTIVEVPIQTIYGKEKSKVKTFRDTCSFLAMIMKLKVEELKALRPSLWDIAALCFLAFFAIISIFAERGMKIFLDDWYHLAVAKVILEKGYIPTWAFWEFAPSGRPHLYPPLISIIIAGLTLLLNGNLILAGKVVKIVTYPLLQGLFWFSTREFGGSKTAFTSLLCFVTASSLLNMSIMIMPATWVLALTPPLFLCYVKKKSISSVVLLSLSLWLHLALPWLVISALLLFSLAKQKEGFLLFFIKVFTVSCLIFSQWLLHVLNNMDWLNLASTTLGLSIPLLVWLLAIPSLITSIKKQDETLIFACFATALLVMLPYYGQRFWSYVSMPISVYAGLTLKKGFESPLEWRKRWAAIIFTILIVTSLTFSPGIYQASAQQAGRPASMKAPPLFLPTSALHLLRMTTGPQVLDVPSDVTQLCDWIIYNTGEDEIVALVNIRGPEAEMITALTGRATTSGMWHETMNSETLRNVLIYSIKEAEIFLIFSPEPFPIHEEIQIRMGPNPDRTVTLTGVVRFGSYTIARRVG